MEILVGEKGWREYRGTVRAGNQEIQAPVARLVFRAETRPPLAKNERPLPRLALGNHAAADTGCGGGALLRKVPCAVPGHASVWARPGRGTNQPFGRGRWRQPRT